MPSQLIIRMPNDLKEKVGKQAKAEGKNVSSLVREVLEDYIRDHDISSYVDDLWSRIGNSLKAKGKQPKDIESAIRQARTQK